MLGVKLTAPVLDLHEDELSTEGGYICSQGSHAGSDAGAAEVIRQLQSSGIPLRRSGRTRFDELLGATHVFVDGRRTAGPAAPTVIVVETPAFAGSQFDLLVAAHSAVVQRVRELWRLSERRP